MTDAAPLASGRDADVYALDEQRVLRRYRAGGDVAAEAEVMRHVAAHGYPVPAVHAANGSDLVLDRVDGPTMLAALRDGRIGPDEAGRTLAWLHAALHAVPGRDPGVPERRVLHLDLHPDNVILGTRGPVVIDWRNAADGAPALDVALTAVILAQVATSDDHDLAAAGAAVLTAFLDTAGPLDPAALGQATARRRADKNMTAHELDRLDDAVARLTTAAAPPED
jgi:Ser/Thr protein kinase RdoA (MazF antagonist)